MNNSEKLILAHMSKKEVEDLSRAQGGVTINEDLDVPEFKNLGEILKDPENNEFISKLWDRYSKLDKNKRSEVYDTLDDYVDKQVGDQSEYDSPEGTDGANIYDDDGIDGDTRVVALPENVYDFLKDRVKKRSFNPVDGFPQFSLGKTLAGILGVAGPLLAPLLGPAGPFVEGLSSVAGPIMQMLGLSDEEDEKNKLAQEHAKKMQAYEANRKSEHNKHKAAFSGMFDVHTGKRLASHPYANEDYDLGNTIKKIINSTSSNRFAFKDGGSIDEPEIIDIGTLKETSPIEGEDKGQDDNIHVKAPVGGYVLDADVVSSIGDGNTDAGFKEINRYLDKLEKKHIKKSKPKLIDCAFSTGELQIDPRDVTAIGKNDLEKGHKVLNQFVKEVRAHKKHSIDSIPPKALPIEDYIQKAIHKIENNRMV